MILVLMIACAGVGLQFAPAGGRDQRQPEKSKLTETVKLVADISDHGQCVQTLADGTREELLGLQLRFTITNVSAEPIIIHRYAHGVFKVQVSKTLALLRAGVYVYDERATFIQPPGVPRREFGDALTGEFRILKPNESFVYEYPENVAITVGDLRAHSENLTAGNYYLQTTMTTWMWGPKTAERLQQQWAKLGRFFYQNVTSEPIALTIDKPGITNIPCATLTSK